MTGVRYAVSRNTLQPLTERVPCYDRQRFLQPRSQHNQFPCRYSFLYLYFISFYLIYYILFYLTSQSILFVILLISRLGILESPMFSTSFPMLMQYARMGYVIGHETTHGFDNNGRLWNAFGIPSLTLPLSPSFDSLPLSPSSSLLSLIFNKRCLSTHHG